MRGNNLTLINVFYIGGRTEIKYFSEALQKKVALKKVDEKSLANGDPKFEKDADDGEESTFLISSAFILSKFLREHEIVSWQVMPSGFMGGGTSIVVEYVPRKEEVKELDENIKDHIKTVRTLEEQNEKVNKKLKEEKMI